tara:strand:- start:297 stop:758 length:462 start_codon:yes stop_codon:yes gene_type:complete
MAGIGSLIRKLVAQLADDEARLAREFTDRSGNVIRTPTAYKLKERIERTKQALNNGGQPPAQGATPQAPQVPPSAGTFEQAGRAPAPSYDHTASQRVQFPQRRAGGSNNAPSDELTDLMRRYGQGGVKLPAAAPVGAVGANEMMGQPQQQPVR